MSNPPDDIQIVEKFCCGRNWEYYDDLKQKQLAFAFKPSEEDKTHWMDVGFTKLTHLLIHLKNLYGGLDKFELVFFQEDKGEPFYIKEESGKKIIFIHLDSYRAYGRQINPLIEDLKVTKYAKEIQKVFSKRVPIAFFKKEDPSVLVNELKNSYYKIIEDLIKEFETLSEPQKQELKEVFEHSKLGTETIKKYVEMNPEAPEKQLKLFLEVIDKLGQKEVEELLNSILKSKISGVFIKFIARLPLAEQNRIIKKMPQMSKMYDRYIQLGKSLKEFRKKIKEHMDSVKKNEKDIHQFLTENYWLLGIEYFDKEIDSDIDATGKITMKTRIGMKHADFIIKRLDGLDKCVVIELEEANDKIFNTDGTLSKKVYEGIYQAIDYYIEQRVGGFNSKGIAVIGSICGMNLSKEQKHRLGLLTETFHNIEVLTYTDIIDKAQTTLDFFDRYEKLKKTI